MQNMPLKMRGMKQIVKLKKKEKSKGKRLQQKKMNVGLNYFQRWSGKRSEITSDSDSHIDIVLSRVYPWF
jgi:hypothetical protein